LKIFLPKNLAINEEFFTKLCTASFLFDLIRWQIKKIPIRVNIGGLAIDNVVIFYGRLVYFTSVGYILRPFGMFYGYLLSFIPFWYVVPRKIWQPWFLATFFPFVYAKRNSVLRSCFFCKSRALRKDHKGTLHKFSSFS
jgi:hypothetical protein